jgi:hypothetical protein
MKDWAAGPAYLSGMGAAGLIFLILAIRRRRSAGSWVLSSRARRYFNLCFLCCFLRRSRFGCRDMLLAFSHSWVCAARGRTQGCHCLFLILPHFDSPPKNGTDVSKALHCFPTWPLLVYNWEAHGLTCEGSGRRAVVRSIEGKYDEES